MSSRFDSSAVDRVGIKGKLFYSLVQVVMHMEPAPFV